MHSGLNVSHFLGPHVAMPLAETLLVAGATGVLGNEVLRRLAGSGRYGHTHVLAREPVLAGMGRVTLACITGGPLEQWPMTPADVGVVMFEPPRMFYERERALWVPHPDQLEALAAWMRRCGVRTLAVGMPHAQGTLPAAVAQGFANLSEQLVSAMGFETVVWVRSAQKPVAIRPTSPLLWARDLVLSVFSYMVPASQQALRTSHVAHAVALALQHAPAGVHVLTHDMLWQSIQEGLTAAAPGWFKFR